MSASQAYKSWIELSAAALASNFTNLRAGLAPGVEFCAVVKANAYGHGLREIVRLAGRADIHVFAVDNLEEALVVRSINPASNVMILGFTPPDRLVEVVAAGFVQTVYDTVTLTTMAEAARAQGLSAFVNLKLETGLHRQGLDEREFDRIVETFKRQADKLNLFSLSTHLANSEDLDHPEFTLKQLERFEQLAESLTGRGLNPKHLHIACSATALTLIRSQYSLVRFGLAMYGHWPSASVRRQVLLGKERIEITPVLAWRALIAQVKNIQPGESVGYGNTFIANRPMRMAVLPVGYYDGYDRKLSNAGEVLVRGFKCPVIGRVAMNMCMLDVSAVPKVLAGDQATLIGRDGMHAVTAEDLAEKCGTINYEILSRLNPFLPRIIV